MTNELIKSELNEIDNPNAIFTNDGLERALKVCQHFMASKALPQSYTTPQAVLMAIQAGRELGMKPIESINGMMVINGQVKLWGTALTGRVTKMGYKIKWGQCTDQIATVSIIDPSGAETGVETYTIDEAKRAGLLGKKNWTGHAKTMLRWRALGNAVKFNFPHLLQGYSLVEDDDNVETTQETITPVVQDNASKLLKKETSKEEVKEKKEEAPIEIPETREQEVLEGEIEEVKIEPKEKPLTVADIDGEEEKIKTMMRAAGSKEQTVLTYYGIASIGEMQSEQASELCTLLTQKIEAIKSESPAAKKMREAKERVVAQKQSEPQAVEVSQPDANDKAFGIPEDVCAYLNSIESVDVATLPPDILLLKIDANNGKFRGYNAYPSLANLLKQ
jgi:hypothetical protein